ncbi:hypothetical protein DFJ74DRAFT_422201 [Hyaloraphidium curvatum]|nr:hypothetical protein DFJ74DRAFT_422201 [Hyaloraphidium curvatum]
MGRTKKGRTKEARSERYLDVGCVLVRIPCFYLLCRHAERNMDAARSVELSGQPRRADRASLVAREPACHTHHTIAGSRPVHRAPHCRRPTAMARSGAPMRGFARGFGSTYSRALAVPVEERRPGGRGGRVWVWDRSRSPMVPEPAGRDQTTLEVGGCGRQLPGLGRRDRRGRPNRARRAHPALAARGPTSPSVPIRRTAGSMGFARVCRGVVPAGDPCRPNPVSGALGDRDGKAEADS